MAKPNDLNGLKGAALALTGVAAVIVAEVTGNKKAQRLYDRIEQKFKEAEARNRA